MSTKEEQITSYKLSSAIYEQAEELNFDGQNNENAIRMRKMIKQMVFNSKQTYYAMMAPNVSYCTFFTVDEESGVNDIATGIERFILEERENLGGIKDFYLEDKNFCIWLGNTLYMIFDYDKGVEKLWKKK